MKLYEYVILAVDEEGTYEGIEATGFVLARDDSTAKLKAFAHGEVSLDDVENYEVLVRPFR